jgi:hypothetical protein
MNHAAASALAGIDEAVNKKAPPEGEAKIKT